MNFKGKIFPFYPDDNNNKSGSWNVILHKTREQSYDFSTWVECTQPCGLTVQIIIRNEANIRRYLSASILQLLKVRDFEESTAKEDAVELDFSSTLFIVKKF